MDGFAGRSFTTSESSPGKPRGFGSDATAEPITPTLDRECELWDGGVKFVAGLDEVGRGPLAGPVVAAAVVFPPYAQPIEGLKDSKQLSARQRDELSTVIRARVLAYGLGAASVREVDRRNILSATGLAMRRAIAHLSVRPERLLVDGTALPELQREHESIVKGDSVSQSIAAASILAKFVRDRIMTRLAPRYPAYHWETNMGYGTGEHLAAVRASGLTPHHRKSFEPIGQFTLF